MRPMRRARPISLYAAIAASAIACVSPEPRLVTHAESPLSASSPASSSANSASSTSASTGDPSVAASAPPQRIVDLPGVDTSTMIVSEKAYFTEIVSQSPSPCGDPSTIDVCVLERRPCPACSFAAQAAARLVVQGEYAADVRKWITLRFDASAPHRPIAIGQSPVVGGDRAPLTLVEFADFECPHCGVVAPKVHALVAATDGALAGKLRLVFKHMPLSMHAHAEPAARAAWAAGQQGKFWPMHDRLFAHQNVLEDADLLGIAKALGCDVKKWESDWRSDAAKASVAADYALGEKVGVVGTPSLFIDGRKFVPIGTEDYDAQLRRWLEIELALIAR